MSSPSGPQHEILRANLLDFVQARQVSEKVDLRELKVHISRIFHGYIRLRAERMLETLRRQLRERKRLSVMRIPWKKTMEAIYAQALEDEEAGQKATSYAIQSFEWFKEELASHLARRCILPRMNDGEIRTLLNWMKAAAAEDVSLQRPFKAMPKVVGLAFLEFLEEKES